MAITGAASTADATVPRTCPARCNCTHTQGFWKNRQAVWPENLCPVLVSSDPTERRYVTLDNSDQVLVLLEQPARGTRLSSCYTNLPAIFNLWRSETNLGNCDGDPYSKIQDARSWVGENCTVTVNKSTVTV